MVQIFKKCITFIRIDIQINKIEMRAQIWTLLPYGSFLEFIWREEESFQQSIEATGFPHAKNELGPLPHTTCKNHLRITSQWIIDLNVRAKTIKREENIISLHDIEKWFVIYDCIRVNLLFSPQNGRKYLQNYISVRNSNPEYIKNSKQVNNKKKNNPV